MGLISCCCNKNGGTTHPVICNPCKDSPSSITVTFDLYWTEGPKTVTCTLNFWAFGSIDDGWNPIVPVCGSQAGIAHGWRAQIASPFPSFPYPIIPTAFCKVIGDVSDNPGSFHLQTDWCAFGPSIGHIYSVECHYGTNPYTPPVNPYDGGGTNPYSGGGDLPIATGANMAVAPAKADPATAQRRVEIDDQLRRNREVKRCPHRTAPSCGCSQVPGVCALGKFGGKPTFADCVACRRDDGVLIRSHVNSHTGYGQHSIEIGKALERIGLPVLFTPIEENNAFLPLDSFAEQRLVKR